MIARSIVLIANIIMQGTLNLFVLLEYLAIIYPPWFGPNMPYLAFCIYVIMHVIFVVLVNFVMFIITKLLKIIKVIKSDIKFLNYNLTTLAYFLLSVLPMIIIFLLTDIIS